MSGLSLTSNILDSPAGQVSRITKWKPLLFPSSSSCFPTDGIELLSIILRLEKLLTRNIAAFTSSTGSNFNNINYRHAAPSWATSLCLLHPVQARDMNMRQRRMMQQKVSVTKECCSYSNIHII
jgi:hypothetical protein